MSDDAKKCIIRAMKRNSYVQKLEDWKASARRKPLVLEGARQVGKTWLMQEFAKKHYNNVVYARFDKDKALRGIFARDFNIERIVRDLEILFHTRIDAEGTVLLFDEIQACKNALTALKYFCEDRPDLHVIAAGSLLGLEYRDDGQEDEDNPHDGNEQTTGFPVGKVNTIPIYPMSFNEYLVATGEERIEAAIRGKDWNVLRDMHEVVSEKLRHYYVVGGMPEAVSVYCQTHNFMDVREVHREILGGYMRDISKHAPKSDVRKIEMCWQSIPVQLAKENKKFAYTVLKKGGRSSEFRDPLAWLEDAGLVYLNRRTTTPSIPLDAYSSGAFKVYALDVGLLSSMSGLQAEVVLEGARVFREFKGALTEQYVCQQMLAETDLRPCYWSTEDSRTEIDFIFQKGMSVCPLEVKSEGNVRSQSLKSYIRKYRPDVAYRASMLPYVEQNVVSEDGSACRFVNVPLYAVGSGILQQV